MTRDSSTLDLLVLGSGVSGLSAAIRAAAEGGLRVGVLTKGELAQSATRWAQGGVAAALPGDPDDVDRHLADTLAAGAGLCDLQAVSTLVEEGPSRVNDLISLGAQFDRDSSGALLRAREGGHSVARIVHAGGSATGAEIERALVDAARATAAALWERHFVSDLLVEGGQCIGARAITPDGKPVEVRSRHTLVTTGGCGQLFSVTTNPIESTGDGMALGMRAGAVVSGLEFTQFHPTALFVDAIPRPLLSEALRGHGAVLRDVEQERFVDELQPRDVVSRAIAKRLLDTGQDHVWLDCRGLDHFEQRFPNIHEQLHHYGLDPRVDLLPVAPAFHYACGGLLVDLNGATTIPGLWACGEVSCSGVHGANRLASNSLLEGMVFAPRTVEAILDGQVGASPTGMMRGLDVLNPVRDVVKMQPMTVSLPVFSRGGTPPADVLATLRQVMTNGAGLVRAKSGLSQTGKDLIQLAQDLDLDGTHLAFEVSNLLTVGLGLTKMAQAREETRGAHTRDDHPKAVEALRLQFAMTAHNADIGQGSSEK